MDRNNMKVIIKELIQNPENRYHNTNGSSNSNFNRTKPEMVEIIREGFIVGYLTALIPMGGHGPAAVVKFSNKLEVVELSKIEVVE